MEAICYSSDLSDTMVDSIQRSYKTMKQNSAQDYSQAVAFELQIAHIVDKFFFSIYDII